MSKTSLNQIIEGIDRNLPYLHKERWALRYADLLDTVQTTTGEEQDRAKQALREHNAIRNRPETSRGPLVEQARENYTAHA